MTVHQVVGPLSKTRLEERPERVDELADFARMKAGGQTALVICNLAVKTHFQDLPGIEVAHYGAMAGRDEWRNVRHLFVTGGTTPAPEDVRLMAAQLTGRPVPAEQPRRHERGILMSDGSGVMLEVFRYDNPDLELVRAHVADASLVQAIGRGRGINRTEETPLTVHVMLSAIHPYPVSDLARWSDVALDPIERMAARGLVLFSPVDAAKVYPGLFPSAEAARKAVARAEDEQADNPLCRPIIKECPLAPMKEVSYRLEGKGMKQRRALVARDRLAGLEVFLSDKLGAAVKLLPAPEVTAAPEPASTEPDFVKSTGIFVLGTEPPFDLPTQATTDEGPMCPSSGREAELLDPGLYFPRVLTGGVVVDLDFFTLARGEAQGGKRLRIAA
jgi:hypothetical protein